MIRTLTGHDGVVSAAAFSPDGKTILTASHDKTAALWDAQSGEMVRQFEGHSGPITCAKFSPDGRRILTGSTDGTVRIWSVGEDSFRLTFTRQGDTIRLFWDSGRLQEAESVLGPWTDVAAPEPPLLVSPDEQSRFYRLIDDSNP